jgi:hypothetical protein
MEPDRQGSIKKNKIINIHNYAAQGYEKIPYAGKRNFAFSQRPACSTAGV